MSSPLPFTVALVGYGFVGKTFHAPLIAATPGLVLHTVVSSDPAKVLVRALPLTDLGSTGGLDLAFSLKTPDAVVDRFRKALETIKKNGTYDSLQKKWL